MCFASAHWYSIENSCLTGYFILMEMLYLHLHTGSVTQEQPIPVGHRIVPCSHLATKGDSQRAVHSVQTFTTFPVPPVQVVMDDLLIGSVVFSIRGVRCAHAYSPNNRIVINIFRVSINSPPQWNSVGVFDLNGCCLKLTCSASLSN